MYKIKVLLHLLTLFTPPSMTQDLSVISNMVNRFRWIKSLMPEIRRPEWKPRNYGYDRQEDITGRNATAACYVCGLDEIAIPFNDTCWTWFTEPDDYTMKFKKEHYMRYCYRNESMINIVANTSTTGIPRYWERELDQILKLTEKKENINTDEFAIEDDNSEGDKHDDRQDLPTTIATTNEQDYPAMHPMDPYIKRAMGVEGTKEDASHDYSDKADKYLQLQNRRIFGRKKPVNDVKPPPDMEVYSRQYEALRPGRHPTYIYSNFTGGCFSRWVDLNGIYTQRGCRIKDKPMKGRSIISKRLRLLELSLINETDSCIQSPMAVLTPFSRSVSLYATYHACVCSQPWCNNASGNPSFGWVGLVIVNYLVLFFK